MGEGRLPQAWIDHDVVLCRAGTENWELVTLKEVGEFGLVYTYKTGEVKDQPVFIPWSEVRWMRPPVPEDLGASESGSIQSE